MRAVRQTRAVCGRPRVSWASRRTRLLGGITHLTLRGGIVLAAVALIASGCGGGDASTAGTRDAKVPATIEVGSDIPYPPFEFGAPPYKGLDVDLVNEIAKRLGANARFHKAPFDSLFSGLARGRYDMVASAAEITPKLRRQADFSDPYLPGEQALVVKRGSDIKTPGDLGGKTVGAQLSTTAAAYANDETKAQSVRTYDLLQDALNALEAGQVDAVIADFALAKQAAQSRRRVMVVDTMRAGGGYGIAFPQGSRLTAKVDAALAKIKADGTYARIYRRWLHEAPQD
jgi:ABC-type amino acid transport substrate-binding protein